MPFTPFKTALNVADPIAALREGLIGEGVMIPGLDGPVPLTYADYVASGRALRQVEDFIAAEVLPFYANSHTETSFCGARMTRLREAGRAEIARLTRAGDDCAVVFAGAGATAGLNRLVDLLGVRGARRAVVLIGPYEHHSNILPWRESGAEVIEIDEAPGGGPDLAALRAALIAHRGADVLVGAFSAASNVTGIVTDPDPVTRLLKVHGALSVWDYAGGGPYLPIDMGRGDAAKDAVVLSPHKFPGGPGASGVMIVRKSAVRLTVPSAPGGGTVRFVSPWGQDYSDDLATREEAGTPNIIGDIRAALVFLAKEAVGGTRITVREAQLFDMARAALTAHPRLRLLGDDKPHRLPIFSLLVLDSAGRVFPEQLFTRMLSDVHGIQARGGCACAGPYGHRLLQIGRDTSDRLRREILAGELSHKPGWVRLNFSYLMDDATARRILDGVCDLAHRAETLARRYADDPGAARYRPAA